MKKMKMWSDEEMKSMKKYSEKKVNEEEEES